MLLKPIFNYAFSKRSVSPVQSKIPHAKKHHITLPTSAGNGFGLPYNARLGAAGYWQDDILQHGRWGYREKVKFTRVEATNTQKCTRCIALLFPLTLALDGVGVSATTRPLYPREEPVPTV
jgi:hypothetical protein